MMNFNVRIGYGYFILYHKNLFAKIYLGRVKKKTEYNFKCKRIKEQRNETSKPKDNYTYHR